VVNGIDTYERYLPLIEKIKDSFSDKEVADVLGMNCKRLFNLPVPIE